MGYFDWMFKQRYDSEKEWLRALLTHTDNWYNQVTGPLSGLLIEMLLTKTEMNPEKYVDIAMQLFRMQHEASHGSLLDHTAQQMGDRGIPLITSRSTLMPLIREFQQRGLFIKKIGIEFAHWNRMESGHREREKQALIEAWKAFESSRDDLAEEINHQIAKLG
jgi:hypothetical protein